MMLFFGVFWGFFLLDIFEHGSICRKNSRSIPYSLLLLFFFLNVLRPKDQGVTLSDDLKKKS